MPGQAHPGGVGGGVREKPSGPATGGLSLPAPGRALWPHVPLPRGPGLPITRGQQAASWTPRGLGHRLKSNGTEFQAALGRPPGPRLLSECAAVCPALRQGLNIPVLPLGGEWGLCLAPKAPAPAATTLHLHRNC